MKNLILLTALTLTLSGCATNSDIEKIQTQIDPIKQDVRELFKATTIAKYAAVRAQSRASAAMDAALTAEQATKAVSEKITAYEKQL